jgi:microcystin-dependent protein
MSDIQYVFVPGRSIYSLPSPAEPELVTIDVGTRDAVGITIVDDAASPLGPLGPLGPVGPRGPGLRYENELNIFLLDVLYYYYYKQNKIKCKLRSNGRCGYHYPSNHHYIFFDYFSSYIVIRHMFVRYRFLFSRNWLTQKLVDLVTAVDVSVTPRIVTITEGYKLFLDHLRTRNLHVTGNAKVEGQLTVVEKVSVQAPADTEVDLLTLQVGSQPLFSVGSNGEMHMTGNATVEGQLTVLKKIAVQAPADTEVDLITLQAGSQPLFTVASDGEIYNSPPITRLQKEMAFIQAQVGDLHWSARTTGLPGWVLCDGSLLSIVTYADLFAVIGFTYGGSEGENQFAVPDARGRTLAAAGSGSGLTTRSIGESVGNESHVLTTEELPAHSHTATANSAGSHSHTYNDAYYAEAFGTAINGNSVYGTSGDNDTDNQFRFRTADGGWSYSASDINTSTVADHTHTIQLTTTGESSAVSLFQPTLFIGNVFIFTGFVDVE